jgi:hypothetical protein
LSVSYIERLHDELAEWTAEMKMLASERARLGQPVGTIPMAEILYAEYQGRHTFNVIVAQTSVACAGGATREQAARECWLKLAGVHAGQVILGRATMPEEPPVGFNPNPCCMCGRMVTAERPGYWWPERKSLVHVDCYGGLRKIKAHTRIVKVGGGTEKTVRVPAHTKRRKHGAAQ